jgi:hypothetical protein
LWEGDRASVITSEVLPIIGGYNGG